MCVCVCVFMRWKRKLGHLQHVTVNLSTWIHFLCNSAQFSAILWYLPCALSHSPTNRNSIATQLHTLLLPFRCATLLVCLFTVKGCVNEFFGSSLAVVACNIYYTTDQQLIFKSVHWRPAQRVTFINACNGASSVPDMAKFQRCNMPLDACYCRAPAAGVIAVAVCGGMHAVVVSATTWPWCALVASKPQVILSNFA